MTFRPQRIREHHGTRIFKNTFLPPRAIATYTRYPDVAKLKGPIQGIEINKVSCRKCPVLLLFPSGRNLLNKNFLRLKNS